MGSGYNQSEATSRSMRTKASTRTPIHFWLTVPMYEYDLGCGVSEHLHTYQTRTPIVIDDENAELCVWCSGCQEFRAVPTDSEPLNRPIATDEVVAFEQDKGVIRERIARHLQDVGFLEDDGKIMETAIKFGVPVGEIKKINAGLRAPEGLSGLPDMCSKDLHEMTIDNTLVTNGRRKCRACWNAARRARRATGKRD